MKEKKENINEKKENMRERPFFRDDDDRLKYS